MVATEQVKKLESLLAKVESRKLPLADWQALHGRVAEAPAAASATPVRVAEPTPAIPLVAAKEEPKIVAEAPKPEPKVEAAPVGAKVVEPAPVAPKAEATPSNAKAGILSDHEEMPTVIQSMSAIEEKIRESKSTAPKPAGEPAAAAPEKVAVAAKEAAPVEATPKLAAAQTAQPAPAERNMVFWICVLLIIGLVGLSLAKIAGVLK